MVQRPLDYLLRRRIARVHPRTRVRLIQRGAPVLGAFRRTGAQSRARHNNAHPPRRGGMPTPARARRCAAPWPELTADDAVAASAALAAGCDPTVGDSWALRHAARKGFAAVVAVLLADGRVDATACDEYALRHARRRRDAAVLRALMGAGTGTGTDAGTGAGGRETRLSADGLRDTETWEAGVRVCVRTMDGRCTWVNARGRLHRAGNLPARTWADGTEEYWVDGVLHRDDGGPAVVHPKLWRQWWEHGVPHRDQDLPAVEHADGSQEWLVHGRRRRARPSDPVVVWATGAAEYAPRARALADPTAQDGKGDEAL
jgi:hypothetical protein